jgi:hypothetical protein
MGEFVILAEARGADGGAVKVAWRVDEEPSPNVKQEAVATTTGLYRRLYGEWPEHPVVKVRDESAQRRTFK